MSCETLLDKVRTQGVHKHYKIFEIKRNQWLKKTANNKTDSLINIADK